MKTAYIKTEIYKYLDQKESEGVQITPEFIMGSLQDIYNLLESDENNPLGGCTFGMFEHYAKIGYQRAVEKEQLEKMFEGSGFHFEFK